MIPFLETMLALPFVAAVSMVFLRGRSRGQVAWVAAAAPVLGLLVLAWLTPPALMACETSCVPASVPGPICPRLGLRMLPAGQTY